MATVVSEILSLLGLTSISAVESTLLRGAVAGVIALGAKELITAIEHDLGAGGSAAAVAQKVPQYAIIDLHNNKTVKFLSTKRVYSILTRPTRRGRGHGRPQIRIVPSGSELVTVR